MRTNQRSAAGLAKPSLQPNNTPKQQENGGILSDRISDGNILSDRIGYSTARNTHLRCVALDAPVEEEHRPTHATTTMTHPQAVWRHTDAVHADDICA